MRQHKEPIISVSGLRGIIGESLVPEVAVRFVAAFCQGLPSGSGSIVIGRDGRTTGPMLADLVAGAVAASGRPVLDAGVAATPTIGVLVQQHQAAGGIQISASHNPPQYNGLKLFGPDGRVLTAKRGTQVLQRYRDAAADWTDYAAVGERQMLAATHVEHLRRVLATVDAEKIRRCRFHVVLDSNEGAGSSMGRPLLDSLGCQTTLLGGGQSGKFVHPPEPTADNLQSVGSTIVSAAAAVGFCQDPDADRLALIDENGRYIGEEMTLALCLERKLAAAAGPVVINCATSQMAETLAAGYHVACYRSAVGEANVVDRMLDVAAVYGGEGNGGPIDPAVGLVRDSFVGMAQVLDLMADREKPLSQLADSMPQFQIVKTTVPVQRESLPQAMQRIAAHFASASTDQQDGLRLAWDDQRWLLIRASNTEPIVRLIAEAPTAAAAETLCRQAAEVING